MRSPLFLASLASSVLSIASELPPWHPPLPTDLRSPCPGLNTLANHNLIPHSGRNLTAPILIAALTEIYNLSPELASLLALSALAHSRTPTSNTLTLADLNQPNGLEHDGSLSRADRRLGPDAHSFRPDLFGQVLAFFNGPYVTIPMAAAARHHRYNAERYRNPFFASDAHSVFQSFAESSLYLATMADGEGATPVEWVKVFFEQERLPYEEGWRPPRQQLNVLSLGSLVLELALATPERTGVVSVVGVSGAGDVRKKQEKSPSQPLGLFGERQMQEFLTVQQQRESAGQNWYNALIQTVLEYAVGNWQVLEGLGGM